MDKCPYSQGYGLPSGHIQSGEQDCKEGTTPKNLCLKTVVLKKTHKSPFNSKEIKPVNLKRNQPWILIWRLDAEAEAPVFWSYDANHRFIGKVPDARKDLGQKKQGVRAWDGWIGHYHCNDINLGKFQEMVRDREVWHAGWLNNNNSMETLTLWGKKCFSLWLQYFPLPIPI